MKTEDTRAHWQIGDRLKSKCNVINNTQPNLKRGEVFVVDEDTLKLVNQVPFLFETNEEEEEE